MVKNREALLTHIRQNMISKSLRNVSINEVWILSILGEIFVKTRIKLQGCAE